jgi:hypothetical protein
MKRLMILTTMAAALFAAGPTETLQNQFDARFQTMRAILQKPVTCPAEELEFLDAQAGMMAAYSAWMNAEENDVHIALARLDDLRRRATLDSAALINASAARQKATEMLAYAQAKVTKLRPLAMLNDFTDAGESLRRLDSEIQAAEAERKRRGASLNALDDTAARLSWYAWWFHQQAESSRLLANVYTSRKSRIQFTGNRDAAISGLTNLVQQLREVPSGADTLQQLPEWAVIEDANGKRLDPKKLSKEARRALERKK